MTVRRAKEGGQRPVAAMPAARGVAAEAAEPANYSKATLARVGRLLKEGKGGPLVRLAEWSGFTRKSIYNWTLPRSDPQYRAMPPSARRTVALLAYFALLGQLHEHQLREIEALERLLGSDRHFQRLVSVRLSRLLRPRSESWTGDADEAALPEWLDAPGPDPEGDAAERP